MLFLIVYTFGPLSFEIAYGSNGHKMLHVKLGNRRDLVVIMWNVSSWTDVILVFRINIHANRAFYDKSSMWWSHHGVIVWNMKLIWCMVHVMLSLSWTYRRIHESDTRSEKNKTKIATPLQRLIYLHAASRDYIAADTKWPTFSRLRFQCIFSNENIWISNTIWLKFVPKGPIDNNTTLV